MFQIFLPGVQTNREQALAAAGLGDLVPNAFWTETEDRGGPGDLSGCFASWRPPGQTSRSGYHPEAQRWKPAVADGDLPAGRYWVGFWNHEKLTPGLLQRRKQLAGNFLTLTEDGSQWLIPCVETFPRSLELTNSGLILHAAEKYRPFVVEAAVWGERIQAVKAATVNGLPIPRYSYLDFYRFCRNALSLNYCLTNEIINELGIIRTDNCDKIVLAVLTDPEARDVQ